jgi:hypothetical protein
MKVKRNSLWHTPTYWINRPFSLVAADDWQVSRSLVDCKATGTCDVYLRRVDNPVAAQCCMWNVQLWTDESCSNQVTVYIGTAHFYSFTHRKSFPIAAANRFSQWGKVSFWLLSYKNLKLIKSLISCIISVHLPSIHTSWKWQMVVSRTAMQFWLKEYPCHRFSAHWSEQTAKFTKVLLVCMFN